MSYKIYNKLITFYINSALNVKNYSTVHYSTVVERQHSIINIRALAYFSITT
jgi:hypothetical protein